MQVAAYYRQYELPWSPTAEVEQRFRRVVRNIVILFVILGTLIPFLPVSELSKTQAPELPDRVVQLVLENRKPVPPPPPQQEKEIEKPKPVEKPVVKPEPAPQPDREEQAKRKAAQEMKVFDALADLRESSVLNKAQQARDLSTATGEATRSERSVITSKVGRGSGGINSAALSRGYGGTTGPLGGHETTQVTSELASPNDREAERTSVSKRAARGREEIDLVFDSNKGAIYSIYNRALRDNSDLKGKVVFELTIAPSGKITACRILSSELNDQELERKLVARVKLFEFAARDVEAITITKPIEFFPGN